MNQWPPEKIQLTQPIRDVRLAWHGAGDSDFERCLCDRVQAAYERGRQDGERVIKRAVGPSAERAFGASARRLRIVAPSRAAGSFMIVRTPSFRSHLEVAQKLVAVCRFPPKW